MNLAVVLMMGLTTAWAQTYGTEQGQGIYLNALLDKYGTHGVLLEAGFTQLCRNLGLYPLYTEVISTCNGTGNNSCGHMCLGYTQIFQRFSSISQMNSSGLDHALSAMVYSVQDPHCHHPIEQEGEREQSSKPSPAEAWGFGIGSASVIVFISNIGVLFKPCMNSKGFQRIMYFFVALAVGTLAATGILVLIPESLGMTGVESPIPDYRWKLIMAIAGFYVFFMIERCIQIGSNRKGKANKESYVSTTEMEPFQNRDANNHGHSHGNTSDPSTDDKGVAPVAWTLLLGDALHNFSDGLAMGAAYTDSWTVGISVSLAILSEELPHELGDIAILLHSGMTIKRALLYNFLAAITIYIGLVIGIIIGANTDANTYIFAFAGGLFVYIALADMIPEMNNQAKSAAQLGHDSTLTVFVHQNIGLLLGFGIVILLSIYGQYISL